MSLNREAAAENKKFSEYWLGPLDTVEYLPVQKFLKDKSFFPCPVHP